MWETTLSVGKPRGQNAVFKQRSFGVHGQIERFVFFIVCYNKTKEDYTCEPSPFTD